MPLTIYPNPQALAKAGGTLLINLAHEAMAARGRFTVALAGGSTPRAMYRALSRYPLDWTRVHVFWGDERCVPPDHPDSNFGMAQAALLQHVAIPPENIHRMRGEEDPALAADAYERELQAFFGAERTPAGFPIFDLILLGLGDDGHTASIFPGTPALTETQRWVIAQSHDFPPPPLVSRLTLTLPVLNAARHIVFLVAGANKAERLKQVLHGPHQPKMLPAQLIQPTAGELHWLVDEEAGGAG